MKDIKKILFIDDEESITELALMYFRSEGYDVDAVNDGAESLKRLGEKEYDLIIADLNMPRVSGYDIYDHVKKNFPGLAGKLIITTGDRANIKRAEVKHIIKPFDMKKLGKAVKEMLAV